MADNEAPATDQETPPTDDIPASPDEETPVEASDNRTESVNWEKRYNDLRPEWDRTKQQLSQYEQFIGNLRNPETQAEALRALGYELEADDAEPEDDDADPYESRFEKIESFLEQQAEAQAQAEFEAMFEDYVDQEVSKLDPKGEFDQDYIELLVAAAPVDEDGIPDIEASHKRLQARIEADFNKRLKAKRAPQAPSGASATNHPDLDDPEARRDWVTQQLMAAEGNA